MPAIAPRRRAVVVTSAFARLPKGMAPRSLVVFRHAAAAPVAIGDASTTPFLGRLVDRHGRAAVLLPTAYLHVDAANALLTGTPVLVTALSPAGPAAPPACSAALNRGGTIAGAGGLVGSGVVGSAAR